MKLNGYQIISEILEMSSPALYQQGFKTIGRNLKRDPSNIALAAAPIPASELVALALHLKKHPRSARVAKVMGRRFKNDLTSTAKKAWVFANKPIQLGSFS